MNRYSLCAVALSCALAASPAGADLGVDVGCRVGNDYRVAPDITYLTASNWEAKLDVYTPSERRSASHRAPHSRGRMGRGSRESVILRALPFLELGYAVVNMSYRLGRVAEAPAAVEDCLCALRWIVRNAKEYGFDVSRIVTTGYSAGGHLALTTAIVPASAGLDRQCPGTRGRRLKVAAVVNWYGITDVAELLDGANMRMYAVQWLGSRPDRVDVARRLSPLTYICERISRRSSRSTATRIRPSLTPRRPGCTRALQKAGAISELVTIPQGRHGNFPMPEQLRAVEAMRAFLAKHGILRQRPYPPKIRA